MRGRLGRRSGRLAGGRVSPTDAGTVGRYPRRLDYAQRRAWEIWEHGGIPIREIATQVGLAACAIGLILRGAIYADVTASPGYAPVASRR